MNPAPLSMPPSEPHLQQTLARSVTAEGVGVHGGRPVKVRLRPSRGSGITFRRVDLESRLAAEGRPGRVAIAAGLGAVSRSDHATTLSAETPAGLASVQTVEHLVAALAASGIDACEVEIDGPEAPILDGSSAPWMELLRRAGTRPLGTRRRVLRVLRPFAVEAGAASVSVHPAATTRLTCSIDFEHPAIGRQEISLELGRASFARELAGARTFGFLSDVERLRAAGLALGASRENTVVLGPDGPLDALRWPDEYVRHKALDLVGDLALVGVPVLGHVVARRAGHRLHAEFARQLLADTASWTIEHVPAPEAIELVPAGAAALAFPAVAE